MLDEYFGQAHLEIESAYYNKLDIRSFMLMLKDPSYCYKFYWLEAIVNLIWTKSPARRAKHPFPQLERKIGTSA